MSAVVSSHGLTTSEMISRLDGELDRLARKLEGHRAWSLMNGMNNDVSVTKKQECALICGKFQNPEEAMECAHRCRHRVVDLEHLNDSVHNPAEIKMLQRDHALLATYQRHQLAALGGTPIEHSDAEAASAVRVFSMPLALHVLDVTTWKRGLRLIEGFPYHLHMLQKTWVRRREDYGRDWEELRQLVRRIAPHVWPTATRSA